MTTKEIKNILSYVYERNQDFIKIYKKKRRIDTNYYNYRVMQSKKYLELKNDSESILNEIKDRILPVKLEIEAIRFESIKKYIDTLDENLSFEHVNRLCGRNAYTLFPDEKRYTNIFGKWKSFYLYYNDVLKLFDKELFYNTLINKMIFRCPISDQILIGDTFSTKYYQEEYLKLISKFRKEEIPKYSQSIFDYEEPWEKIDTSIYARSNKNHHDDNDGGFDPGIG
jgi:hypothetical protein